MTDTTKPPRDDRFPLPLKVHCSFEQLEGFATLTDISYTGALLGNTGLRPKLGTLVKLCLYLKPPRASETSKPSELVGVVIRHSSDGFAVVFEDSRDPDMRRMVDSVAALVAT